MPVSYGENACCAAGKIVYGEEGEFSLGPIHDISETGARISPKPREFIPTNFFLADAQEGRAHEAATTRTCGSQSIPQFGLKFDRAHELENLTARKLKFLKKYAAKPAV